MEKDGENLPGAEPPEIEEDWNYGYHELQTENLKGDHACIPIFIELLR
jgi:hypothetical protein